MFLSLHVPCFGLFMKLVIYFQSHTKMKVSHEKDEDFSLKNRWLHNWNVNKTAVISDMEKVKYMGMIFVFSIGK